MIPDGSMPVIILPSAREVEQLGAWAGGAEALLGKLRSYAARGLPPSRAVRRALQRYTVSIYSHHFSVLLADGAIELVGEHFPVLLDETRYTRAIGLSLDRDRVMPVQATVV